MSSPGKAQGTEGSKGAHAPNISTTNQGPPGTVQVTRLSPPIGQFIINTLLQILGFGTAIAFGVFAVKSVNVGDTANVYSDQSMQQALIANQLTLLSVCLSNGNQSQELSTICAAVLNQAALVLPSAASVLFPGLSTVTPSTTTRATETPTTTTTSSSGASGASGVSTIAPTTTTMTASAALSTALTTTTTSTSNATSSPIGSPSNSQYSNNRSVIIGASVGGVCAALVIIAVIACCCLQRRFRRKAAVGEMAEATITQRMNTFEGTWLHGWSPQSDAANATADNETAGPPIPDGAAPDPASESAPHRRSRPKHGFRELFMDSRVVNYAE
ncbi:hypothetical protein LTR10_021015 [Elasticomyces elasticus]|uniref:Mid2 domain-containing protein n=1 Tax=Exophiala sideris TaxID=1016849 RepID=A0ABR0JLQ7_9EURO|nr:hypothetical protein LTR10_021015 [Elasticomyces elasticus]KAK5036524.1 hypothetical protein LTS07_002251 [Exophiala sideris]KAK5041647.1 hypothetical protein LTR13_002314 [Exophiala sideris]KAK5066907.1 hypothetical protein LTR69_002255 [Exophiala sideris]KAK5184966.1 hypothetical protein LTR44_002812 [Eurotiomycetes sp. CCFEE 6388]